MPIEPLPTRGVHVWVTSTASNEGDADALTRVLAQDEQDRLTSALDHVRIERVVSRALARQVASRYAEVAPAEWIFQTNEHGRPDITSPATVPFKVNVAHSGGIVACAIGTDRSIGVDVEDLTRPVKKIGDFRRFLSAAEHAHVQSVSGDEQRDVFFRYWTLKEAYVKAHGVGIAYGMNRFTIDISGPSPRVIDDPNDDGKRWSLETRTLAPHHRLSIAASTSTDEQISVCVRSIGRLASWGAST